MKDLGTKEKQLYESMAASPKMEKVRYPSVDLPISIIDGKNVDVDDTVTITLKGVVTGLEKSKWRKTVTIELKEGEIAEAGKKGKSLLDQAK